MQRQARRHLEGLAMRGITIVRIHGLPVADVSIFAVDIDPDPVSVLVGLRLQVITGRQVLEVFRAGRLTAWLCEPLIERLVRTKRADLAQLGLKLGRQFRVLGARVLGHPIPPMIRIGRVGIEQDLRVRASAVRLARVSPYAAGEPFQHGPGHLARLVDPGVGQLHGQKFSYVVRTVQGDENNLPIKPIPVVHDVVRRRPGVAVRAHGRRYPLMPGLDRGGL